jgi:hypothetical protein
MDRFRAEAARWALWRDSKGRRAFAIPTAAGSDDAEVTVLDRMSMADWMRQHGFVAPRLRWLVDYSCRDDYGSTIDQTSAWAGLFYFASRLRGPHSAAQPLVTWPEGNGRIVLHLAGRLQGRVRSGVAALALERTRSDDGDRVEAAALDVATGRAVGYRARRVVLATAQYLAPYLIRDLPPERVAWCGEFEYVPWLVANVHLSGRPRENGFPLCWDNVLADSRSLGYVTATHQTGLDHGPTVLTWYLPLCDEPAPEARQRLLDLDWHTAAETVLSDLETAHPDVRGLVERLDVMKWGHAMVRPKPGFVWSAARRRAREPFGPIHFAGTDLSGLALCEEAVHHGVRAAEEALAGLGRGVETFL